eukprot:Clim_evm36s214 gene=Clim_evmTU36s214
MPRTLFALLVVLLGLASGASAELALLKEEKKPRIHCVAYNPRFSLLPTAPDYHAVRWAEPRNACNYDSNHIPNNSTELNEEQPNVNNGKRQADGFENADDFQPGEFVLSTRGNCSFVEKAKNIPTEVTHSGLVVFSNVSYFFTPAADNETAYDEINIPIVVVGFDIKDTVQNGERIAIYVPEDPVWDWSMVVLFIVAIVTMFVGAVWSNLSPLDLEEQAHVSSTTGSDHNQGEDGINTSKGSGKWSDAAKIAAAVAFSSAFLTLMYWFYSDLIYLVLLAFYLGSIQGFFYTFAALRRYIPVTGMYPTPIPFFGEVSRKSLVLFAISWAVATVWLIYRKDEWIWWLRNFLGFCFVVTLLRSVHLGNLKVASVLGLCFFMYDTFFVFITPYLTKSGTSVMVGVAAGHHGGGETMPVIFTIPRFNDPWAPCGSAPSMLGYGDVIVPGLVVALGYRFDRWLASQRRNAGTRQEPWPIYLAVTTLGYVLGLGMTFIVLTVFHHPQPALIYLLPGTIGSMMAVAVLRGQWRLLWQGKGVIDHALASVRHRNRRSQVSSHGDDRNDTTRGEYVPLQDRDVDEDNDDENPDEMHDSAGSGIGSFGDGPNMEGVE